MPATRWLVVFAVIAAGVAAGWLGYRVGRVDFAGDDAEVLPSVAFALPDVDGVRRSAGEWGGRTLLVNFWATWCAPCREEVPLLVAAQQAYGARGLQVVGVAIDEVEAVRTFGAELGINYPSLVAAEQGFELMRRYGNPGALPFSVLFDADGRVHSTRLGPYAAGELTGLIESLLEEKTSSK